MLQIPPKPPVKEQTKPEAFRLITDIRAVERAEFDDCVSAWPSSHYAVRDAVHPIY